jgi:endonuclease/exonuclease/phosphatase family metal-dependent hydrolase
MSYNVHHCNPPLKPDVIDLDAVAAVLKKEGPDIVALQEIDMGARRSGSVNQAAEIAAKAGYPFFYFAKAIDFDGGEYGVAILSKFPISDTRVHRLPTDETIGGEPRVLATALVTLPNKKLIRFGATHLDAGRSHVNRLLQMKEISRIAGETVEPFVIAGDFNAREGSEVIDKMDVDFTRSCRNCQNTFNEEAEQGAIDFIAWRQKDNFAVRSHRVVSEKEASDHLPIVALLQLKF